MSRARLRRARARGARNALPLPSRRGGGAPREALARHPPRGPGRGRAPRGSRARTGDRRRTGARRSTATSCTIQADVISRRPFRRSSTRSGSDGGPCFARRGPFSTTTRWVDVVHPGCRPSRPGARRGQALRCPRDRPSDRQWSPSLERRGGPHGGPAVPGDKLVRAEGLEPPRAVKLRGFSYRLRLSPPRRAGRVCGLDYPFTVPGGSGVRCCPSSLYTFPAGRLRPGLARDRHVTGFPEFGQFCIAGFPASTQVSLKSAASAIPPRPRVQC